MTEYNFDEVIDRRNTNSVKYDFAIERGKPDDLLPFWVADMDFRSAPPIIEALTKRAEFGIYGYSDPKISYFDAMIGWMKKRHGWETEKEWYMYTPGVIFALGLAIRGLTNENDSILIQRPVYYPFTSMIEKNHRKVINNPLVYNKSDHGGYYNINFEDFERKIIEHNVKLFILSNPHNPVGRVWKREELERMGDICVKHKVLVLSDEIHQDFVFEGYQHEVFAKLKPEYKNITITCTSPSKTFNIAGTQVANTIVANKELRDKLQIELDKTGYDNLGIFGLTAAEAAYSKGEDWLDNLKRYLKENVDFLKNFLETKIPKIKLINPEGTYLCWLDCSELGLSDKELDHLMTEKAKLWLDSGLMFGEEGTGFQRINIATSKITLEKALLSLENAVNGLA